MSHPLEGVVRMITLTVASAGGGKTSLALRPAAGMVWEILYARAYQDDGAVVQGWEMVDPDQALTEMCGFTAAAAYDSIGLGQNVNNTNPPYVFGPLVATYDRYYSYHFTASAGGKNSRIEAVVKEFRGVAVEA